MSNKLFYIVNMELVLKYFNWPLLGNVLILILLIELIGIIVILYICDELKYCIHMV